MFLVFEVGLRVQQSLFLAAVAADSLIIMPFHLSVCLCVYCISVFVTECVGLFNTIVKTITEFQFSYQNNTVCDILL